FWQQHPGQWEFVTGGCEILTRDGIFVGGSRKEVPVSSSILGRKNEIADLKTNIQKVEAEIEEIRRQRETIAAGQKKSQEDLLRLQSEIRSHDMAVATRLGEFRVLENSLRGMKQREETLKQEMTRLTAQDAESTAHRQLLSDQIVEIEQKEKETADNISEINSSVDQLRQERDTAHNALTEVKIALASKEQFCNTHRLQKNSLENQITEQERLITARTKEIAQIQEKVGICHAEIEESKLKIEFLTNEYEQMNQRIADLSQQKKTVSAEIEEREARLKELRGQLNRSQEQHEALNVQIAQRQMTLQNTTSRMQEKYQLDILTVIQEPFRVEETEEGVRIFRKD
ncbi:MAG: hypothetical protein J6U77_05275, partial [Verrucomicrobia bacterium]|nr:hypothetical protein [Verrucomicrobiota bacterium]